MTQDPEITWQSISVLPMIAQLIRGTLENTEEQYQTLQEAEGKPHVLNDALVDRVIRLYTVQAEDVDIYEEQLARWKKEHLTPAQKQEVDLLTSELQQLRQTGEDILTLAGKLKEGTIEKVLEKDDVELALEFLLGKRKP